MAVTVQAVVLNGLLKPMQPLPFKENEQVTVIVQAKANGLQESHVCGWNGDAEQLAFSPDIEDD